MEQCHDIGEELRQDICVGAAIKGIYHDNAVFARKGAQRLITRMPLTQSICGEVDQHELGAMIRLDPM